MVTQFYKSLILLLIMPLAFADSIDALVGTVNGANKADFQVLRGEEKFEVIPMMALQDGDWLCVKQPTNDVLRDEQNYIMVNFGGDQAEKVTFANSPYLVKKRDTRFSLPGNVVSETKLAWDKMFTHFLEEVQALTRGDESIVLSMPLLNNSQKLVFGHGLSLAWLGGNEPYLVDVYHGDDKILSEELTYSKQVQFADKLLEIGNYKVVVKDSEGKMVVGEFEIVDSLPVDLKAVERYVGTGKFEQVLFASWLAQKDDWKLEAYQRVVEEKFQAALLLKSSLEKL